MDPNRKPKIIALSATLSLTVAMVTLLACGSLKSTLKPDREWPPESHSEIVLEELPEETFVPLYAQTGDNLLEPFDGDGPGASDITSKEPTQVSHDAVDRAPAEGKTTKVTTSQQESPAQVKENDRPQGNSNPQEEAEKAEAQRRQKAEQNIANQLNNRFSGKGEKTGNKEKDNDAQVDGDRASSGKTHGKGLGMTASADVRPSSSMLGTIVVNVTVLPNGRVAPGSATINISRCSGNAGNNEALRNQCKNAAYNCRFSRPVGETENRPGTITFKWE